MMERSTIAVALALLLAACSNGGDGSALPALKAEPSSADPSQPPSDGPMDKAAIRSLLAGRTWNYEGAEFRGVITFNADGTIDYDQAGQGRGTGKWHTVDGKLCESFDPGPVTPSGRKVMCFPFRSSHDAYYVLSTRLTPATP